MALTTRSKPQASRDITKVGLSILLRWPNSLVDLVVDNESINYIYNKRREMMLDVIS